MNLLCLLILFLLHISAVFSGEQLRFVSVVSIKVLFLYMVVIRLYVMELAHQLDLIPRTFIKKAFGLKALDSFQ